MTETKRKTAALLSRLSRTNEGLENLEEYSKVRECTLDEFVESIQYCENHASFLNRSQYNSNQKNNSQICKDMWNIFREKENYLNSFDFEFNSECSNVLHDIIKDLFGGKWGEYKLRFDSQKFKDSELLSSLVLIDPNLRENIYNKLKNRNIDLPVILENSNQISIFLNNHLMSLNKVKDLVNSDDFGISEKGDSEKILYIQELCLDALHLNPKSKKWLESVRKEIRDAHGLEIKDSTFKNRSNHILFSVIHNNPKVWNLIEESLTDAIKIYPDFGNRNFKDFNPRSNNINMNIISSLRIMDENCGNDAYKDLNILFNSDSKDKNSLYGEYGYQILFGSPSWERLKNSMDSGIDDFDSYELSDSQKEHIQKLQSNLKKKILFDNGTLGDRCESLGRVNPNKFLNIFGGLCLDSNVWDRFTDPDSTVNILDFIAEDGLIQFNEGIDLNTTEEFEFTNEDKKCCRELIHFDTVLFENSQIPSYIIQNLVDLYSAKNKMTSIEGKYGIREVLESLPDEISPDSGLSYFTSLLVTATEQSQSIENSPLSNYSPVCLAKFLTPTLGELFPGKEIEVSNLINKLEGLSQKCEDPSGECKELSELLSILSESEIFNSFITKDQYNSLDELWGSENGLVSKKYMDNPIGFNIEERKSLHTLLECPVGLAYLDINPEPTILNVIKAMAYYEENPTDCLPGTDYELWNKCKERLSNRIGIEGSISFLCSESNSRGMPQSVILDKDSIYDGVSFSEIYKNIYGDIPSSLPKLEYQYDWFDSNSWLNGKDRMNDFEDQISKIIIPGYTTKQLPEFLNILGSMSIGSKLNSVFKSASKIANSLFSEDTLLPLPKEKELVKELVKELEKFKNEPFELAV